MFGHKTSMHRRSDCRFFCSFVVILLFSFACCRAEETKTLSEAQRMGIALEALSRIESDIKTNAELKTAVYKLLGKIHGQPQFVQIVKKFQLKDQDEGLFEIAASHPAADEGVEAMRMILANDDFALINKTIDGAEAMKAAKVVEALGNAKDKKAVRILLPLVTQTQRDVVLRKMAVKALAQTEQGATSLLTLAKEEKLPADLKLTATSELHAVHWVKIREEADKVLALPQGQNAQPLPSVAELMKIQGNPANGQNVFFREQSMCSKCHRIKERGGDVGPNLSEIGSKLGKDALFEAIIDPSAGISLGYEAFSIDLKSGDEVYGLIVSDSEDELAIKDLNGIVTRYKKSDVANRKQSKLSLMPNGLPATMSTQDLVDLVDFLSKLRKTN